MFREFFEWILVFILGLLVTGVVILTLTMPAHAYSNEAIATAIYHAENSKSHPYGILKHYKTTSPRAACLNTIKHARRDFTGSGEADFIIFLAGRYCPIGAANDPRGLNKNWIKNVLYFLKNV